MKIIETADWHVHPRNFENTVPAMEFFADYVEQAQPDLVIHAGDLFDTRGRLDPTSIDHVRRIFRRIVGVTNVIVVPGNHDAANAWDEIDSASAVLQGMHDVDTIAQEGREIGIAAVPGLAHYYARNGKNITVAALPCPSKYHLAASQDQVGGANVVDMMGDILRGLAVEAEKFRGQGPIVLVFHGGVAGASYENEQIIGVGQDVTLPREFLNGPWDVILAGHLHKAQEVEGVHYSGSLTQLNFSQADYEPSFLVIETRDKDGDVTPSSNGSWDCSIKRVTLPVAHPFVDVKVDTITDNEPEIARGDSLTTITQGALLERGPLMGANVRVKIRARSDELARFDENHLRTIHGGVKSWKFVIERVAPIRIRSKVKVDTPLPVLLREWISLNEHLEPLSDPILKLASEIDEEVGESGTDLAHHYRPIETTFQNFKSFRHGIIDWQALPTRTVFKGPNGSGKTKAALAEPFALFGVKALGSPLARVVRNGTDRADVEHVFEIDGVRHRIRRSVKLSSSGKPAGDVELAIREEAERNVVLPSGTPEHTWRSLNAADSRATQKKIEELVGTPEMFFATRFARQHEIDKLLKLTPAELKTLLQEALQAGRFALLEEAGRVKLRALDRKATDIRATLAPLSAQLEGAEAYRLEWARAKDRGRAIESSAITLQEDLRVVEERLETKVGRHRTLEAKIAAHKATLEKISAKQLQASDRKNKKTVLQIIVDGADVIAEKIERVSELKEIEIDLVDKQVEHLGIEAKITAAEERQAGKVRARKRQIETLENDLSALRHRVGLLDKVPCQNFDAVDWPIVKGLSAAFIAKNVELGTAGCEFLTEAVEARDSIGTTAALLEHKRTDRSYLEEVQDELHALLQEQTALGFKADALGKVRAELERLDEPTLNRQAAAIAGAEGKIEALEEELAAIKNELALLVIEREGTFVDQDQMDDLGESIRFDQKLVGQAKVKIDELSREERQLLERLGSLSAQIEAADAAEAQIAEANVNLHKIGREALAADAFVGAVGRDGIPFLILERSVPRLQDSMNELLDGSPLAVEIEPLRDLVSGKVREEITISFDDQNGRQVLQDASGYQANLLGVALRAGIAELEADRAGVRPEFFIIDEGFGAYDPDNVPHGREMIHRLAERFGRVVYITHVPEVQEAAQGEIVVTPSTDGSTLEEVTT